MAWTIATLVLTAAIVTLTSWLSKTQPRLAGFLLSLPLSTMMALAFSYSRYQDVAATAAFAKSIFLAIPLSLFFFVPFLFARTLEWGFWTLYGSGVGLLAVAYYAHRLLFSITARP
jgi:hypothetical protein